MDFELLKTLIYFVPGGFLIFLAITVTRDNFINRLNRLTGAMLFFAGLGPVAMVLGDFIQQTLVTDIPFDQTRFYNLYLIWELFFPSLLVFSWIFPIDQLRSFKRPRWRYLVFVPQVVHILLIVFYVDINNFLSTLVAFESSEGFAAFFLRPFARVMEFLQLGLGFFGSYHENIFNIVNLAYTILAWYFIESGKKYVTNPRLRAQMNAVVWALRFGMGFIIVAFLSSFILSFNLKENVETTLLILGMLSGGGLFTYAIFRYQFLDVQLFFRQSIIYTFMSAILVGVYIILGVQSKQMLTPIFGDNAELVSYILIIFLLLLFQPISNWVDNFIRSMFMRTRSDYRNVMEHFSRQIISSFDPAQLRQIIEETLKTALLVEKVYFVLYDDQIQEYAVQRSEDYPRRSVIEREDLMLRGINLLDTPTFYDSLSEYAEDSRLADILTDQKVKLILPMKDAKHLLGFLALTSKVAGYRYSSEDINLLGVLSNQMVTALTNARLYVESLEKLRLEEEVNMARQIQLDLLPSKAPEMKMFCINASSTPSRTVGGDFYDFIKIRNKERLGIVIADASGKGMPAALLIAQIQAIIHSEVNNGNSISIMLKNMNELVAQSTSSEKYVTLFYGELDEMERRFYYANAGHNYPILVRADGNVELLEVGGPIIGAFPFMEYQSAAVELKPDDVLFFFTDGLSEAMDTDGNEYSEERIRNFVVENRNLEPVDLMKAIIDDVQKFDPTYPPQDDTTIIAMKMLKHGTEIQTI